MKTWHLVATTLALGGCASSTYDRRWVADEVTRATGHAAPTDGTNGSAADAAALPPGVTQPNILTADDAVATALWNSARFRADLAQLGIARADLADAGALPNPTLAFLMPVGPRQLEASLTYPLGTLIQRPWRVAAAKLDVEQTARSLVQVALDLARDVRIAHAELVLAERRIGVRQELERTLFKVSELTDSRYRRGDASLLETRSARAEALGAADQTARAHVDVRVAKDRLRRLVGLARSPLGGDIGAAPPPPPPRKLSSQAADLERMALAARPDVRASEIAIEAAGERLGWERSKVLQLVARLDLKPVGTRGAAPSYFLPGAQFEIPIFNWNPGGRGRAQAQMEQAAYRYAAVRDDVLTEVRVAHAQLEQAMGSLAPWRDEVVPMLDANVTSAVKAFEVGGETFLVVLEAVRRAQEAKLRELDLEADVWRAKAAVDRAVGTRLDK